MSDPNYVTVSIEDYAEMNARILWLDALEAAGVDNWEGVEEAMEIYIKTNGENND